MVQADSALVIATRCILHLLTRVRAEKTKTPILTPRGKRLTDTLTVPPCSPWPRDHSLDGYGAPEMHARPSPGIGGEPTRHTTAQGSSAGSSAGISGRVPAPRASTMPRFAASLSPADSSASTPCGASLFQAVPEVVPRCDRHCAIALMRWRLIPASLVSRPTGAGVGTVATRIIHAPPVAGLQRADYPPPLWIRAAFTC